MEVIFVIVGHAGDYDDYRTWLTKGFYKRDDATDYQAECIKEANRISSEINSLEKERFIHSEDRLPEVGDPIAYWTDVQAIIDSNEVDIYFEYDSNIDYTIEGLEVE